MYKLIAIIFIINLHACSVKDYYGDLTPGDQAIVNKALTINANDARVSIQNGKVVEYARLDHYYPHCWFISLKRNTSPQIIKPDTFRIVKIRHAYEYVMNLKGGYLLSLLSQSAGLTAVSYMTEIDIASERQKNITRLLCSHWEDPEDAEHLSIAQINQTLGSLVSITLKNN